MELIKQLYKMVESTKDALVVAQRKYNTVYQPDCDSCPGAHSYYEMRTKLVVAHEQYRAALAMLVAVMGAMKDIEKKGAKNIVGPGPGKGKEFVLGTKKLRSHCEPWTVKGTTYPDDEMCAVVCRNQPSCVGFARDPVSHWCLWFDDVKPQGKGACSSKTETEFLKNWQAPENEAIWTAMEKVNVFDHAITEALRLADDFADFSNKTFVGWWEFEGKNSTVKLAKKDKFMGGFENYTGTIVDTFMMRKQFLILQKSANLLLKDEAVANPPKLTMPPPVLRDAPPKASKVAAQGFKAPLEDEPAMLKWKDFPNSEDTAWSKIHPECPMGTPCICDCKCRGAPPQNFVEPPPLPALPCPLPPPLPSPAMLSAILR